MDPSKYTKDLEKEMKNLGAQVADGGEINPRDIEAILKEVYGSIGQEVPKPGQPQQNPLQGVTTGAGPVEPVESTQEKLERIAEAKNQFVEGQKMATEAVKFDSAAKFGFAARHYDKALICFAKGLAGGFPKSDANKESLVATMTTYLNRTREILLTSTDRGLRLKESTETVAAAHELNQQRRMVISEMGKHGFKSLVRAVELKKKAKEDEDEGNLFEAFVRYQECLDCLLAYNESDKVKENEETKQRMMKLILNVLDKAEGIKKNL